MVMQKRGWSSPLNYKERAENDEPGDLCDEVIQRDRKILQLLKFHSFYLFTTQIHLKDFLLVWLQI